MYLGTNRNSSGNSRNLGEGASGNKSRNSSNNSSTS